VLHVSEYWYADKKISADLTEIYKSLAFHCNFLAIKVDFKSYCTAVMSYSYFHWLIIMRFQFFKVVLMRIKKRPYGKPRRGWEDNVKKLILRKLFAEVGFIWPRICSSGGLL
jgi:hypothetical protein